MKKERTPVPKKIKLEMDEVADSPLSNSGQGKKKSNPSKKSKDPRSKVSIKGFLYPFYVFTNIVICRLR